MGEYFTMYIPFLLLVSHYGLNKYERIFCNYIQRFNIHRSVHRKYIRKDNQQDASFPNLFISVRHSTCFRRVFRPLSGAQN